jgi:hypothetical protein
MHTHSDPLTATRKCSHVTRLLIISPKRAHHTLVSTVVQHTVRNSCSEAQGLRGTKVFSAGTGGRGLLGQRVGALAPQGHETFRGGARMTWLFHVLPGNVKP